MDTELKQTPNTDPEEEIASARQKERMRSRAKSFMADGDRVGGNPLIEKRDLLHLYGMDVHRLLNELGQKERELADVREQLTKLRLRENHSRKLAEIFSPPEFRSSRSKRITDNRGGSHE